MNFFIQMKESVTDFSFYRKIKDNRFGKSFAYFTILMLIIFAIGCTKMFILADRGLHDFLDNYLPDFKIQNGEFSSNVQMPHYVANDSNSIFIIDTSGRTDRKALGGKNIGLLITKDHLYINNKGQHTEYTFKDLGADTITKSDLQKLASNLGWIALALTPFIFIFILGWKLLNAVILALLAMVLSSMYKVKLKYNELLSISMYALTLPLLLQLAVSLSGYNIPFEGFFYWVIALSYVGAAIRACSRTNDTPIYSITNPSITEENPPAEQIPEAPEEEKAEEDNKDNEQ